jgi:hypothetical protein
MDLTEARRISQSPLIPVRLSQRVLEVILLDFLRAL